jgi:tRNA(fMet)-specific endonuclease VapC
MKVAMDTNRYRDLFDGLDEALEIVETADVVFIPLFVLGELRAGFAGGKHAVANEEILQRFLGRSGIEVLLPTADTSKHYASLFAHLRSIGKPIPTNDIWIAALCVQHGVSLYTRDRHFDHLPTLSRV